MEMISPSVVVVNDAFIDLFFSVAQIPTPSKEFTLSRSVSADDLLISAGGCGNNTTVALARLGVNVIPLGALGKDLFTDFLLEGLQREGVDTSHISINDETGNQINLYITDKDGRNLETFYFVKSWRSLKPSQVDMRLISKAKIVFCQGHHFTNYSIETIDRIVEALDKGRRNGSLIGMDPNKFFRSPNWREAILPILKHFDFLLPNEYEALLLTGCETVEKAANELISLGPSTVIIKEGEKGCYAKDKKEAFHASPFKVKAGEPTGAGDAFNAGFIYGQLQGWSLRRTCHFANACGAIKVTKLGSQAALPTIGEVETFMRKQKTTIKQPS
jgi:sugar/nucleoside kinase (ribokinase family)